MYLYDSIKMNDSQISCIIDVLSLYRNGMGSLFASQYIYF